MELREHLTLESAIRLISTLALILVIVATVVAGVFGCADRPGRDSEHVKSMSQKTIEQVQEEHTKEWMAIDGVEGTAIGLYDGKPCIKIFSSKNPKELRGEIPSNIEGYPVIIEESGIFRSLGR